MSSEELLGKYGEQVKLYTNNPERDVDRQAKPVKLLVRTYHYQSMAVLHNP